MDSGQGEIQEHGIIRVLLRMRLDILNGPVPGDKGTVMPIGAPIHTITITPVIKPINSVVVVIDKPVVEAIELIEAAVGRGAGYVAEAQMPFADHVGFVAQSLQRFLDQRRFTGEALRGVGSQDAMLGADPPGVAPGQEGTSRRPTGRRHVVVLQGHPVFRQLVHVGRFDLRAVVADIIETQIVNQEEDKVGPLTAPLVNVLSHGRGPHCKENDIVGVLHNECVRGNIKIIYSGKCW